MSRHHQSERAFFISLHQYNVRKRAKVSEKVAMLATEMGDASRAHIRRYYPDCKRG